MDSLVDRIREVLRHSPLPLSTQLIVTKPLDVPTGLCMFTQVGQTMGRLTHMVEFVRTQIHICALIVILLGPF